MREILVSVAGLTPQVITETLYHLTQVRKPPAEISEIWVITTVAGKQKVERELLDPRKGQFFRFCHEYGVDVGKVHFGPEHILAVRDRTGKHLADIRTPEDNTALADFIISFIRDQTSDPTSFLHCSVAGGRKTMGLCLGLALQLYGRPTDTLSHVLISPPEVESHPAFYYPPQKPGSLNVNGHKLRTSRIRVELAQIPLLMLRGKLPSLETSEQSYSDLVRLAQEDYALLNAPPQATIDLRACKLIVGNKRLRLSPLETAIYLIFSEARRISCGQSGCRGCTKCTLAASDFLGQDGLERLRKALRTLKAKDVRLEELRGWGTSDPTDPEKRFREVRSRLNRKLQRGLGGDTWPTLYTIAALRLPGEDRVRYGIRLDPRLLTIR